MSPASFRTRKRLWAIISAILFIAPWFFVLSYKSGDNTAWKMVAAALRSGHPSEALEVIGGFTLLLAPPALAVGWLIHWLVVTLANGTKTDRRNLAPATQRMSGDYINFKFGQPRSPLIVGLGRWASEKC